MMIESVSTYHLYPAFLLYITLTNYAIVLCCVLFYVLRFSIVWVPSNYSFLRNFLATFLSCAFQYLNFLFDLVSRNIHSMLKKILLALGVVVTISALGMKIVKFSNGHIFFLSRLLHNQSFCDHSRNLA